jgi:hypothetical protein
MMSKKPFAATHAGKAPGKHRYGVVGGLGVIAGADLLLKMIGAAQRRPEMRDVGIAFEQRHFDSGPSIADATYNPSRRKFYVYNTLKEMEARGIDTALVPCFVSHTFLREITPELDMRVISLFDALRDWAGARASGAAHDRRIDFDLCAEIRDFRARVRFPGTRSSIRMRPFSPTS